MKIKILNYLGRPTEVDVGDLKDIQSMYMTVISGDEILDVEYKDGRCVSHDSAKDRTLDYFDDQYVIYNPEDNINLLTDDRFLNRTSSYWRRFVGV